MEPITNWPSVIAALSTIAPPEEPIILLLLSAAEELVPPLAIDNVPPILFKVKLASLTSIVGFAATPSPFVTDILVDAAVIVLPTNVSAAV